MPRGLTGAIPAPHSRIMAVPPFVGRRAAPTDFARVPAKLAMWGNDQYGDCVTAEEAFKCATDQPEDFIREEIVIAWARDNGFLNGAMLPDVMDAMAKSGFDQDNRKYGDGPYTRVDFSNESQLCVAIATGTVKIGIDSRALPSGAGNKQGWYATGGRPGQFGNTDHCVALTGYGTADFLYKQLGVPLPSGLQPTQKGYLLFTWSTIGFVDHDWIISTTTEAYVRNPQTVFDPAPPTPPTPPTPTPTPGIWELLKQLLVTLLPILVPIIIKWLTGLLQQAQEEAQKQKGEQQKSG